MRQGRGPQRERGNGGDHSRDKGQERTRKEYPAAHRRAWARTWVIWVVDLNDGVAWVAFMGAPAFQGGFLRIRVTHDLSHTEKACIAVLMPGTRARHWFGPRLRTAPS